MMISRAPFRMILGCVIDLPSYHEKFEGSLVAGAINKYSFICAKEHEGEQNKYACAFGGIQAYRFYEDGRVSVVPLVNVDVIASELENRIKIFFTGETYRYIA